MPEPNRNAAASPQAAPSLASATGSGSDTVGLPRNPDGSPAPDRLGEYVLLGELGRGGMGVVYRAEDPRLKREVALKVMLPQFAANPQAKARFVREARAQAKVEHDHVAAIHQVAEHDGLPYLVMPLLKGMTLHAALRANPRPPLNEVIRIGREVAEGLAAAHEKGLVHRDIKPANIWLEGKKLRVKVLDFGLARIADAGSDAESATGPVTREGAVLGTPAYMSPEQGRASAVDGRTDLWSLGVMLYQMTTGEMPFTGATQLALLTSLALDNPLPPIAKNPAVPQPLSDLVMRLLSKDPAYRPPSAEILAEELRAIEAWLVNAVRVIPLDAPPPIILAPEGPDPFANLDATEMSAEETPAEDQPLAASQATRGFPMWAIVGVVLLAVVGVVGFVVSQLGKKPVDVVKDEPPTPQPKIAQPKPGELLVLKFGTPPVEMKFRWIPPGEFMMGSDQEKRYQNQGSEKPVHKVTISRGFWMAETETTQAQWKAVMGTDPSRFKGDNLPVERVTWNDANAFCDKLGQWSGKLVRLPTEAQWEYACRAGTSTEYHTGNGEEALKRAGWYDGNSEGKTHPVGQKEANAWGLRDMHGNVHELCLDDQRTYTAGHQTDPQGQINNNTPVVRSGAWDWPGYGSRAAFRGWLELGDENGHYGFRVVWQPEPTASVPEKKEPLKLAPGEGFALAFDGQASHVEIPSLSRDEDGPLTIEAYVTVSGTKGAALIRIEGTFPCQMHGWPGPGATDWVPNGLDHRGTKCGVGTRALTPGRRAHLAVQISDQVLELYIDGKKANSVPRTTSPSSGTVRGTTISQGFIGNLDEIRISKVIRYKGDFTPQARFAPDKDTLALYHVDEGAGEKLTDSSNGGHHGKIVGAKWVKTDRPSADRIAAEYVLSIGGTVGVDNVDRELKAVGELPAGSFQLTFLNLSGNKQVTDAGLAVCKDCKNLTQVILYQTQVGDTGLAHFKEFKNLGRLQLNSTRVSDAGLAHLSESKNLWWLELASTQVTDAGLANFKDCRKLGILRLNNTQVTDAGLAHLKDCKNLIELYLDNTKVSDAGLANFKECKALSQLGLSGVQVSDAGLTHFKDCKNLGRLNLANTQVTDAGLKELLDKTKLGILSLQKTKVTEAGVKQIAAALPQCKIEWDGGVIEPAKK